LIKMKAPKLKRFSVMNIGNDGEQQESLISAESVKMAKKAVQNQFGKKKTVSFLGTKHDYLLEEGAGLPLFTVMKK